MKKPMPERPKSPSSYSKPTSTQEYSSRCKTIWDDTSNSSLDWAVPKLELVEKCTTGLSSLYTKFSSPLNSCIPLFSSEKYLGFPTIDWQSFAIYYGYKIQPRLSYADLSKYNFGQKMEFINYYTSILVILENQYGNIDAMLRCCTAIMDCMNSHLLQEKVSASGWLENNGV